MKFARRNIKLSHRLTIAFGLLLGLLLLVTAFALQRMRHMDERIREVVEHDERGIALAQSMMNAINATSVAVFSTAVAQDQEDVRFRIEEINNGFRMYDSSRKDLANLLSGSAEPTLVQQLERVDAADQSARALVGNIQTAAMGDVEGIATRLSLLDPRRGQDAWLKEVATLVQMQSAAASSAYDATRNVFQVAQVLLIATSATAIVLAVVALSLIIRSVTKPLRSAIDNARRIASGDLTGMIDARSGDEVGDLLAALAQMQTQLRSIGLSIKNATNALTMASEEIVEGNGDLSIRTEQASAILQEVTSAMQELQESFSQSEAESQHARELASIASDVAKRGGNVVDEVVRTMEAINVSSRRVFDIIRVIDDIAFQTNILALNAAVEAARAGETGRGFAVVAGEVRNLAQRSAEAAKEIKELIEGSVASVGKGRHLVQAAGNTMKDVVANAGHVHEVVEHIGLMIDGQMNSLNAVRLAVTDLERSTEQNASLAVHSAKAAESMKNGVDGLRDAVSSLRLEGDEPRITALPSIVSRFATTQS